MLNVRLRTSSNILDDLLISVNMLDSIETFKKL